MNVLVTGASGQLGTEIKLVSKYSKHRFYFENSKGLDITDSNAVKAYILNNKIDFVINCGAYTAVDLAEENLELAKKVNGNGVKVLLDALGDSGKMIHISTDYVFDGNASLPLKETDETDPVNGYGTSKRLGEEYFLKSNIKGVILRVSWLYSCHGKNFVKTMRKLGTHKESLNVVADQFGSPTYAKDLAEVCVLLLDKDFNKENRIYHYSNKGSISWFDFALEIMEISGLSCKINPIETKDYPTLAKRPRYSVLDTTKIQEDFKVEIPFWKDSLKRCIEECK